MVKRAVITGVAAGLFGSITEGKAQEAPWPDKHGYNLFNPTPEKYMREI